MSSSSSSSQPRLPLALPPPGTSPIADRIRQRRGARGLTPLDGTLLHAPEIADGWNTFVGGLRGRTSLRDDVRELMICRIAAINSAAFEWIHHEHVARSPGLLTYEQLALIGHPSSSFPLPLSNYSPKLETLTPLQQAALEFADASTRHIKVPEEVFKRFKEELERDLEENKGKRVDKVTGGEVTVEQQILEAMAVVGGYNMVSRLLVGLNVDGKNDWVTPVPEIGWVEVSGQAADGSGSNKLHALKIPGANTGGQSKTEKKTLIFVNSLMTNYRMWSHIIPHFSKSYDLIFYDQRGHGASTIPSEKCTMDQLADDVAAVLDHFGVEKAEAVIGVSQGGATTLNFAIRHPERSGKIVACDTQASTPAANVKAWDERIELARTEGKGMKALAEATVPRWFAEGSNLSKEDEANLISQVSTTPIEGFATGASALQTYDLLSSGLIPALSSRSKGSILLIAGELDGKLPEGLKKLGKEVEEKGGEVRVEIIGGGGHLPMVNRAEEFGRVVVDFLK